MLLIPEIEAVVIQPPRTGSTSLRDAVLKRYPNSIQLYRHMERTGIPKGYERWHVHCLVREPFDRLVSVYNYMKDFRPTSKGGAGAVPAWIARMARDVDRSFEDWLQDSTEVFTNPVQLDGSFLPFYNVDDATPIVRKSQYVWARPDLGPVTLIDIGDADDLECLLDVQAERTNAALRRFQPDLTPAIEDHLERHFGWDLEALAPKNMMMEELDA